MRRTETNPRFAIERVNKSTGKPFHKRWFYKEDIAISGDAPPIILKAKFTHDPSQITRESLYVAKITAQKDADYIATRDSIRLRVVPMKQLVFIRNIPQPIEEPQPSAQESTAWEGFETT